MAFEIKDSYRFYDLVELIARLRGENGCPWDKEQTHESIRRNLIEEACEAAEAIDDRDPEHLKEELGDVMMQVVFHAGIESDADRFDIDDVVDATCKKLVSRHPHVFGDVKVGGSDDVLKNWDEIKKHERKQTYTSETMRYVSKGLPALWHAEKVQDKAAKVGFDWPEVQGALDKLSEELDELKEAIARGRGQREELGDLFFAAVNVARFIDCDPEDALRASTMKFIDRFERAEHIASVQGKSFADLDLEAQDELYNKAKAALRGKENE